MKQKILVVDDEPDIVEFVGETLLAAGYAVLKATSGEEALRVLRDEIPGLIIADINMPEVGGFEMTQKIRRDARLAKTPILFISAMVQEDHAGTGLETGDYFMSKPISSGKLLQKTKDILA